MAQTSDLSLLLLYFPCRSSWCKKGTSRCQRRVLLPIHVPIILSRTWVTWLQTQVPRRKHQICRYFPSFVSPNWTIIHYNKGAICICILLSSFRESVRSS